MAIFKNLTIADSQSLGFPVGTTAQRPAIPATGMIRGNTTIGWIEVYDGAAWKPVINAPGDGLTAATAGRTARSIKALTGTTTNGMYWIKTEEMSIPTLVYCDMGYDGGGYMLVTYGFVNTTGEDSANRPIPNLNHDGMQFEYNPFSRASNNGLVTPHGGQQTAVKLGRASTTSIWAAGGNPTSGGINSYTYVYRIDIPSPKELTFRNHSYYYNTATDATTEKGASVNVVGLKGDTSTVQKYLKLATLSNSWGDSYPSGYGAGTSSNPAGNTTFDGGPFFPSVHSGSGHPSYAPSPQIITPDLGTQGWTAGGGAGRANIGYTYRGWYRGDSAGTTGNTGQMSIWFK
jgi:hypothetical protein